MKKRPKLSSLEPATNSETTASYRTKSITNDSNSFIEVKAIPNTTHSHNESVQSNGSCNGCSIDLGEYKADFPISFKVSSENKQGDAHLSGNKPRSNKESLSKCPYSPFVYHRFIKQERCIHGNGSKSTILRCRYCALLVQIWVGYRQDKEGRMIAYRKTNIVEDEAL